MKILFQLLSVAVLVLVCWCYARLQAYCWSGSLSRDVRRSYDRVFNPPLCLESYDSELTPADTDLDTPVHADDARTRTEHFGAIRARVHKQRKGTGAVTVG